MPIIVRDCVLVKRKLDNVGFFRVILSERQRIEESAHQERLLLEEKLSAQLTDEVCRTFETEM